MHGFRARAFLVMTTAVLLTACSGSSTPTATPAGGGGDVSSIKACSLLTPAEIQTALGVPMKDGLEQDSSGQVACNWDAQDNTESTAASISVATYDDAIWQTFSHAQGATPVSGFGEAAFSGYPVSGDLSIKQGGYIIDIGVAYFGSDQARVTAADSTFATLVLSRL
jgi:hypothetical protein